MTEITSLSGAAAGPARGEKPDSAVVFLHGYGADGNDLIGLAPFFSEALPNTVFLSPNAPEPCEMGGPGGQWFSLATYDPNMLRRDPEKHMPVWEAMLEGANAAAPKLHAFLDEVLTTFDLPPERVALVGFSQGTMMALHVGLRRGAPLAGIQGYSGALLGPDRLKDEVTSPCPISLVHGSADSVVPVEAYRHMTEKLTEAGLDHAAKEIAGLQHGIDRDGAEIGRAFIAACFKPEED